MAIVTSLPLEPERAAACRDRAVRAGFCPELISLDAKDALPRLLSQALLHFPAGHTAHLLHRLRPMASELKTAWEQGLILSGSSGGGLCWFSFLWSASMFGDPEWVPGLSFAPGAATAHHDQPGYRHPKSGPQGEGAPVSILALENEVLLDWTPQGMEAIAIRPGAGARVLQGEGAPDRPLKTRHLSPLFAWIILARRVFTGQART